MAQQGRPKRSFPVIAGEWMALAFILPASIAAGVIIGYLLDRVFGTNFLYIVFLLIGIAAGFKQLLAGIERLNKRGG